MGSCQGSGGGGAGSTWHPVLEGMIRSGGEVPVVERKVRVGLGRPRGGGLTVRAGELRRRNNVQLRQTESDQRLEKEGCLETRTV